MDVTGILGPLNAAQREAVTSDPANLLVLAGAGSGKTRVLAHRVAWLIETSQTSPHGVLSVTFTNKAAAEMRGRIQGLLRVPAASMWVGTFHGIAHRLLRYHAAEAGLPPGFQILDSEDQYRLIRRSIRASEIDESLCPPREVQWFINARKDEGLRSRHLDPAVDPHQKRLIRVYRSYEEHCTRAGLCDFAELLLRAHELWRERPDLLAHYRERFRFILVDEFQDTNAIQYAWLRQLAAERAALFIVGDDDQSIYGWRGARVGNMQSFQRDFPGARLLRLEQNYRSTATILKAANAVIANNTGRLGKELWTEGAEGAPLERFTAFNEQEEARYCIERILSWRDAGRCLGEGAILYRVSAQSRVFEEALRQECIPYRVYGGFRFYERAEVKDVLAYLRLIACQDDDAAFERVINTPNRGIGLRSLEALRARAREEGCSLWRATTHLLASGEAAARASGAFRRFLELVEELAAGAATMPLAALMEAVIERTGLAAHYRKEKTNGELDRLENLAELVNAAREFTPDADAGLDPLSEFLALAALDAGESQADGGQDAVQLMTLHSAKGLEFPLVFLVGLEEGLFPHQRSVGTPAGLEEERRLCYVGITRAQERLILTHAEARRLHGSDFYSRPSRFLAEIPAALIAEVRAGTRRGTRSAAPASAELRLGQRVAHPSFGEGVVLGLEGQGPHARVQVRFERLGPKWLVASYARLMPL